MRRVLAAIGAALMLSGCGGGSDDPVAVLDDTGLCVDEPSEMERERWQGMYGCRTDGTALILMTSDRFDTDSSLQLFLAMQLDEGTVPVVGDGWVITSSGAAASLIAERTGGTMVLTLDDIEAVTR